MAEEGAAAYASGGAAKVDAHLRRRRVAPGRALGDGSRPRDLRRGGRRGPRVPRQRGRGARDERRGVAEVRPPRLVLRGAREGARAGRRDHLGLRARQDAGGLLPGARRHRLRDRQVARGGAVRRHPLDGDEDRRPRRRARVRRGDPRRVPRQDAGLQPLAVVQLGLDRHERRRDAPLPGGARQAGLRLQLHHLRRPPDRRPRGRGVRDRAEAGRDARARPPAAEDPAGRVAVPDAADAGRRPARRRRAARLVGTHGDHQGDGQGLDAAPAPDPDRGAEEAARGVARAVERALQARPRRSRVELRPHRAGSELLELAIVGSGRAARATRRSPTSSSRRSTTAAAGRSSRCATRTPSTRRCARSA